MVQHPTEQTDAVISELSSDERFLLAMPRLREFLVEVERSRMPFPDMVAAITDVGTVRLIWAVPCKVLFVDFTQAGDVEYTRTEETLDNEGESVGSSVKEGRVKASTDLDELLAWLLLEEAAEA